MHPGLMKHPMPHASFRHSISGNALALLALSFRPVTVDCLFQCFLWNFGKSAMPVARLCNHFHAYDNFHAQVCAAIPKR
jgi:hypothetical protein